MYHLWIVILLSMSMREVVESTQSKEYGIILSFLGMLFNQITFYKDTTITRYSLKGWEAD